MIPANATLSVGDPLIVGYSNHYHEGRVVSEIRVIDGRALVIVSNFVGEEDHFGDFWADEGSDTYDFPESIETLSLNEELLWIQCSAQYFSIANKLSDDGFVSKDDPEIIALIVSAELES